MTEPAPPPDLLRALGRLVRGLSALFWGLPVTLVVCFHAARSDSLRSMGVLPPLICTTWLLFGLWQLADFRRQERIWRSALDRALVLSLVNVGLSPFLFWWNRVPNSFFFTFMVVTFAFAGLLFLASLNLVLRRLGAMLPDTALQLETKQFTALNLNLLAATMVLAVISLLLHLLRHQELPTWLHLTRAMLDRTTFFLVVPLVLLPLAMTMALLWKTKEVILDSVFKRGE